MNQNNQEYYYRKINTTNSTPKSININQYNKTINYKISNTNINNNITNFIYPFTPMDKFNKKFLRDSADTSQNSSDIKFEYTPSLKEQILSPEDDDINQKRNTYSTKNSNIYIDENYFLNYDIKPSQMNTDKPKKILILDLDETLVHSSFYPFNSDDDDNKNSFDIFFTILFNQKYYDVYVLLRPYFTQFINKMSKIFNIYIFTASIKAYAEPLLIKLDKNNLIQKKLYRESCTLSEDKKYIKDLNTLNENLKNVILLDNNPNSYRYNKCNGLPIKTWHSEANDKELIKIIPFLTFLATVDDVREYIPNVVDNDEINYDKVFTLLNKYNLDEMCIKNDENNNNNINSIKKCEKKLINIIKKNSNFNSNNNNNINTKNKNKNRTYSNTKIKISYPQLYAKNISINKNSNNNNNNKENNYLEQEQELNNNFAYSINYNKFEEKKNNNYNYNTLNTNNTIKYFHSPATINFCEPPSMNDISKVKYNKNITNNAILTRTNLSINKIKKIEKNKYIRSKSSYNFNDLTENSKNKFSTINFNLINNNQIIENKNKTNSNITRAKKSKTKIKNYKSINNNKHSCYNNYMKNPNDDKASLFLDSNVENYLFTLNQKENYKCVNNNMINNINLNNNKSLEKKMSLSTRLMKVKNSNNNININNQKENMFRHKNALENNKNEEIQRNSKYNLIRGYDLINNNNNKIHNLKKSGKQKRKKLFTGRNNDNIIKRNKNMDKFISVSNTNELNNNNINNNDINNNIINKNEINNKINYINKISKNTINNSTNNKMSLDNDNTIQKKTRCSTLNSHYMNNHHKKLKDIIEENKNNTMEINKSLKSRFFNNDNRLSINLKGISRKNKNFGKNYNKGNKTNKNINREINLLNKFMKEFEEKKINNKSKENKTQRDSNYNFNYNYNYYYNNPRPKNLDSNGFYFTKRINNSKINKGNNSTTYLRKNNKINFYDNDYINLNDNDKNSELSNFTNAKNMKYSSLEKASRKNRIQKYSEMGDKKNNILINNKSNYLIKLYYSYASQKI